MPELPEVETIARTLRLGSNGLPGLPGRTVSQALVFWERTLAEPVLQEFLNSIKGLTIQSVSRRGKFLVIDIPPYNLLIHLRMSGDLRIETNSTSPQKHDRVLLLLDNDTRIVFNDTRKFGRMWLTQNPENILGRLGFDPLNSPMQPEQFFNYLHPRKSKLKPLLMDQSFLAGLGNIYTDEALHLAKLHPTLQANSINPEQAISLFHAIQTVLTEGIARNGASIDWVYRGGTFQNQFKVYRRTGKPCLTCGTPVCRIIVGQRSTHYCPTCQPESNHQEV